MNKKRLLKILILSIFIFPSFLVNAQINLPSNFPNSSDYLQVKIRPENPGPNEKINIGLELYITDLKKAEISWSVDGELQKKDFGLTNFELITKSVGESQTISILIDTFEGTQIRKNVVIRPADVDIVWNANSYTPPFYKGRALLTGKGGGITISAIPNIIDSSGTKINPKALNYKWYKDNTVLSGQSGFGKDSITINKDSIPRPFNIRVIASTLDNSVSAQRTLGIDYLDPKTLVYENHPLYGLMLNRAITDLDLESQEITLSAIPYFFSESFKNSNSLTYTWRQNGKNITQPNNQSIITLRKDGATEKGKVNIEVSVQNRNDFTQTADKSLIIDIK